MCQGEGKNSGLIKAVSNVVWWWGPLEQIHINQVQGLGWQLLLGEEMHELFTTCHPSPSCGLLLAQIVPWKNLVVCTVGHENKNMRGLEDGTRGGFILV